MTAGRIVRLAADHDLDEVVQLRAEMFSAMGVPEQDTAWRQNARDWFAARLDDPSFRLVVVEVDGAVVSVAMGAIRDAAPSPNVPGGGDVHVSNICTLPESRGRGHARAAFDAVMDWARRSGVERAELFATEHGHDMYVDAGFSTTTYPAMRAVLNH